MTSPYVELWEAELVAGRARADRAAFAEYGEAMRRAFATFGQSVREALENMRPALEALAEVERRRLRGLERMTAELRRAQGGDSGA